ncbi:MAG TPA: formimidoylglutamate deiminase [Candidatus Lambdaproteobacteria bacterium]|jgi:formiminoglutamate deiminase|nr:formimidoylglutamate deiminase [Candidatus Lambdaproteobacteria bacterium]
MKLFAELALTSTGWEKNVRVTIDERGCIAAVESGIEANGEDQQLNGRILLPALANLHSHAFQRAMAGLTEQRLTGRDSFWSWRELMYRFLERLTPEHIEAIAALVFMEMLECGYASVGEFHYVHHQVGGTHHDNIAETSLRAIAAAQQTGIGLTHLPVFYMQGGVDGKALAGGQLRFGNSPDEFAHLLEQAQAALSKAPEDYVLGIAPHSLRAAAPEALATITDARPSGPIHIHIAEQVKEVEELQESYGARPVEWLLHNRPVDARWCLIHATHMTPEETAAFAKSGAVAGLCPITEANLGDGIFDGPRFLASGGKYGVGSDSNVRISLAEELRLLEYGQRLAQQARNVLVPESGSVGRALYESALAGGAQALARNSGRIEAGRWADLLTLDAESLLMWGCAEDEILDRWIFAGDDSLVREVWSAGRAVVENGRHVQHEQIARRYRFVIQELQEGE